MSSEWKPRRFDELVEFHDHKRIPLSKRERAVRSGPYPYYGAQGIIDWLDDYLFDGRYLLIAEDGENLNSRKLPVSQIVDGQFWVNNHAHVVKALPGIADDDFLRAAVEYHPLNGLISGAAQPKLSQASLKRLVLPAPNFDVQRQIGSAIRAVDGLITNNERRIEILEAMAGLIYKEWFVRFRIPGHEDVELVDSDLGPIPEGWDVVPIEQVCARLQAGSTPKRSEARFWNSHDVDWYKTGELQDDFLFGSEEGISAAGAGNGRMFEAGTILMAIYGSPTVGRLGILTESASCNQAALGFVADPEQTSQQFLYYKLLELRTYFNSIAQGAAQQNISKVKVAQTLIGLPSIATQQEFTRLVEPIWTLKRNLGRQIRLLCEARDLLLPRLISGELNVSDLDLDLEPVA